MEPQTRRIKVDSVQEEPMAMKKRVIDLLPTEQLLRELLLECAQHFPGLEIWVTGGWVRDRLLGIPSSDLDFALSNVTGRKFGELLEHLSAKTEIGAKNRHKAAELGIPYAGFTRFHITERNEKKSKKLETAGGKLLGLDIDLVNLRKEVYDGHSRTPEMEFGTPEEDAFRRDATINSLFFHLEKQEVVDLTGTGLEDLDAKIMRTPLDPRQTFMDDPLRVLRLIRLGSKLGFAIDPQAMRSMRDKDVQHSGASQHSTSVTAAADLPKPGYDAPSHTAGAGSVDNATSTAASQALTSLKQLHEHRENILDREGLSLVDLRRHTARARKVPGE